MKYRKSSLFLVTLMVLAMLGAAFVTVPTVSAYTITVDGDPSDWQADTSGQAVNTFEEYIHPDKPPYIKEYVWKDELGDDTGNGSWIYPTDFAGDEADLMELRITWDASYLYLAIKIATVQDWNRTAISLLIDQDRDGTGTDWWTEFSDTKVVDAARWEWGLSIAGPNKVGLWDEGFVTMYTQADGLLFANSTTAGYLTFEVGLPTSLIGNPGGKVWRFSCAVGVQSPANPWGGDVFAEVFATAGVGTPGGGDGGWEDSDIFDLAFAPSKAAQEANLGNFTIGAGVPGVVKTLYYQDVAFYNQQQGELYVGFSADPDVYDPFNVSATTYAPSDTFTVYIKARNINDLLSMDFYMNFDGALLNATDVRFGASWGTVLVDYVGVAGTIDNVGGHIDGYAAARLTGTISGNLTLFEIDFLVEANIDKTVRLQIYCKPIIMLDSVENPIYVPMTDGWIWWTPPPPAPTEAIINENATSGPVGTTFHIWSESLDASNGTHVISIVREDWNITDSLGANVFSASLGRRSEIFWTATYADTYTVLLEVFAPDPSLPPGYDYDSTTSTKLVFEVLLTGIDAFTEKERLSGYTAAQIGIGPGMPADAYAPDEEATLYAYAFYNGWPEEAALVTFEVYDANDALVLMKVAETEQSGLANISFRIPKIGPTGKWHVDVRVSIPIDGPSYTDTLWFDVGLIVHVQDIIPMAKMNGFWEATSSFTYPEHMGFLIVLKNIAMAPRNVTIAIHIFDDVGTPITVVKIEKSVPGGEHSDPYVDYIFINSIEIPKWFRPGTGTVEADVWFDDHAVGELTATFLLFAPEVPFPDP